jgi:hypothetical protein
VQPYNQLQLLSFVFDFVKGAYNIDTNRILVAGPSMGGSGASRWGVRSGHIFSSIISWVGIHLTDPSGYFFSSYELVWGSYGYRCKYSNEALSRFGYPVITPQDNIVVWDYWDNKTWLEANISTEMPWMSYANGSDDDAIGWQQAIDNTDAMEATKRPFNFSWCQCGHGARAGIIGGGERYSSLDLRKNQSMPAFTNCSIDDNYHSVLDGQVNQYFFWNTSSVVDDTARWEMEMSLDAGAPQSTCTVNITPRRLQKLMHGPGSTYTWELVEGATRIASGNATAGADKLITIQNLTISKTPRILKINCASCVPTASTMEGGFAPQAVTMTNCPNPFNPSTTIRLSAGKGVRHALLGVYDLQGKLVKTLINGGISGEMLVTWDGSGNNGKPVSSGIYICRLDTGNKLLTKKMALMR